MSSETEPEQKTETDEIPARLYLNRNLVVLYTVTLTAILGVSSITPAFPDIVKAFGIDNARVGLLITVFTLPGVVLTPVFGVLADRYGRKPILVPALLLFAVAGTSAALARDFTVLLGLRFLQGIGAASLGSLNVTLIGDLFEGRTRTAAMGYNASVLSIGTASYPLIGGFLASIEWWVVFLLPALGFVVASLVLFVLDNPRVRNRQTLRDYFGNAWKTVSNKNVIILFIVGSLTFVILFGSYLTYFPLLVGNRFNQPSNIIGLLMASTSLTTAIVSANLGRLTRHVSEKKLLSYSFLMYATALALIPLMPGAAWLLVPAVLFGLGHGVIIPSVLTLIAGAAPSEQRAAVMSVNGMVIRVGQTLGPLVVGGMYTIGGLNATFWTGSAISLALFGLVMVWRRRE